MVWKVIIGSAGVCVPVTQQRFCKKYHNVKKFSLQCKIIFLLFFTFQREFVPLKIFLTKTNMDIFHNKWYITCPNMNQCRKCLIQRLMVFHFEFWISCYRSRSQVFPSIIGDIFSLQGQPAWRHEERNPEDIWRPRKPHYLIIRHSLD